MQGPDEYRFIYNDGTYQILEEEPTASEIYYEVDKNYKQVAAFKDKKEAFLWVGWKNKQEQYRKFLEEDKISYIDNTKAISTNDLNEPKGILKDV
jgi:hypothetical protein